MNYVEIDLIEMNVQGGPKTGDDIVTSSSIPIMNSHCRL